MTKVGSRTTLRAVSPRTKRLVAALGVTAVLAAAMFVPVPGSRAESVPDAPPKKAPTFEDLPADKPDRPVSLLFIHHSCGGQLLAAEGPDVGKDCIYTSHPSGGGLRAELQRAGYVVHEASYGSAIGEDTDLFDWAPKFGAHMDDILHLEQQDARLPAGEKNDVVVFKSCFPNNQLVGEGEEPGDPRGPALTVANAKAALRALLPLFEAQPDTLFVYVTAPPAAPRSERLPLYRVIARALKGRREPDWTARQARWARQLNDWVVAEDGWLAAYKPRNVVVFDLYGALTGDGASNLLHYPGPDDADSHAASAGNKLAARAFVPLLNRAVRRHRERAIAADTAPQPR